MMTLLKEKTEIGRLGVMRRYAHPKLGTVVTVTLWGTPPSGDVVHLHLPYPRPDPQSHAENRPQKHRPRKQQPRQPGSMSGAYFRRSTRACAREG